MKESTLKNVTQRYFTVRGIRVTPHTTMICYGADPRFQTLEEAITRAQQLAADFKNAPESLDFTHYRVIRTEYGIPPRCRKAKFDNTDMIDIPIKA